MPAPERFEVKVQRTETCWLWTAHLNDKGYGRFGRALAHRFAYELWVGPIPAGLVLDHLCRNRACVRPDHLEPVTQRENLRRGEGFPGQRARSETCVAGHALSGDNLYIRPNGVRQCRECARERDRHRAPRQRVMA